VRLAFLLTQLEIGGAQTRVFATAAELRRRGHEVDVVFLYEKRSCFLAEPKVILHQGARPSPAKLPGLLMKLRRFLTKGRYDVLVTNTAPANVLGCSVGWLAGMKRRFAVQTQPPQRLSKPLRLVDTLAGRLGVYTVNIANSEWTRNCFSKYPAAYRKRMVVVKNGIAPPVSDASRAEARASFGLSEDEFVVVNVGRLSPQKDQTTLIAAMAGVSGRLLVAGEGELREDLEKQAEDAGIAKRVTLLGEMPRPRVADLFHAADVFAFSSRWETFGLALVEAASMGLPLVVTDLDVSREVLGTDEASALFIQPGDAAGFTEALQRVAADPALREEMKQRSLKTAGYFTIERHVDRLLEVLQAS